MTSSTRTLPIGALVTVIAALAIGTGGGVGNGQSPALTLPGQEKPLEPGDAAHIY